MKSPDYGWQAARWLPIHLPSIVLALLLAGCQPKAQGLLPAQKTDGEPAQAVNVSRPANFAGSQACTACHAETSTMYANHPMGQSAGFLGSESLIEDYQQSSFSAGSQLQYEVERTPTGVVTHTETKLRGEQVVYKNPQSIEMFLGSGHRRRSYLLARNELFLSPISWYAHTGKWQLSPGFAAMSLHFEFSAEECIQCHLGRITKGTQTGTELVSVAEASIGCERCHGPSQDHVAWQSAKSRGEPNSLVSDPIVKISSLAYRKQLNVCEQCHFVGAERVLRSGKSAADFRPGDELSDIWVTFSNGTTVEDGAPENESHSAQMHSSRCFLASEGKLQCTSCHDPHQVPNAQHVSKHYRDRCLVCHGESQVTCSLSLDERVEKNEQDACIDCHMPKRLEGEHVHLALTDHRVMRKPTAFDDKAVKKGFLLPFDACDQRMEPDEFRRAQAILMVQRAVLHEDQIVAMHGKQMLDGLNSAFPQDLESTYHRARANSFLEEHPQAIRDLEAILQRTPDHGPSLKELSIIYMEYGEPAQAIQHAKKLLELHPRDLENVGNLIYLLGMNQQIGIAMRFATSAVEQFPADPRIRGLLSELYKRTNQLKEAAEQRELQDYLDPRQRLQKKAGVNILSPEPSTAEP